MSIIRAIWQFLDRHNREHYATEGPYDDGHYWEYYRCKYCNRTWISSKKWVDVHGEPDQPWPEQ